MPFSDRDKGRLFDRLRGKSGQDLLNEVKTAFDSDNMFVDSPTFAERRGFPRVRRAIEIMHEWACAFFLHLHRTVILCSMGAVIV